MNPIVPVKHIIAAVRREARTSVNSLILPALSPSVWAALSPAYMTFNLLESSHSTVIITTAVPSISGRYSHFIVLRDPTLHS